MSGLGEIGHESHAWRARSEADSPERPGWLLEPDRMKVWEDAFHVLHLRVDGKEYENVRPRRVFPLSEKADYVSFLDGDDKEVALLTEPQKLDKESRDALDKALEQVYYVARILRVDSITEAMGVTKWEAETDRGYAAFEVVDRRQHIRKLPGGRLVIMDADGNRFEVERVADLDERSQTLIHSET
ncbi:MAG: DUF1854 domain-containing protein [Planctomycetota bacterium]|jgi:hypothetical protein